MPDLIAPLAETVVGIVRDHCLQGAFTIQIIESSFQPLLQLHDFFVDIRKLLYYAFVVIGEGLQQRSLNLIEIAIYVLGEAVAGL